MGPDSLDSMKVALDARSEASTHLFVLVSGHCLILSLVQVSLGPVSHPVFFTGEAMDSRVLVNRKAVARVDCAICIIVGGCVAKELNPLHHSLSQSLRTDLIPQDPVL